MDLLLTHGYFLAEDPREQEIMRPYPPLGLLYLSSHLKREGFGVEVFDTTFRRRQEFARLLESERPPRVGIYGNLITRRPLLDMIRLSKEAGATVILGGPEPANYAEEYLRRGADVVVIGEGELTLAELLSLPARGGAEHWSRVRGIVFRDPDGTCIRNPPRPAIADLDAQPFPDRAAIDLDAYLRVWRERHGLGSVSLITARGCPYECNWCSHGVFGFTHRRRTPAHVADELEAIVRDYAPDMLWYADDVFTIHHRWLEAYAQELRRRGLRLPFETISREDRLNQKVIRSLAEMGCRRLWIGAESGSQRILDAMQRRTKAQRVTEMVALLKRHGIETGLFIMLGYEGEELSDIEATVAHLKATLPDTFLTTVAYPIRDTPYYQRVEERLIRPKPWAESTDRDLTVAGRHTRRFYGFATRWMVHEVARHRERLRPRPDRWRLARSAVQAAIGRAGMRLTQHQVEQPPAAAGG
ncbi:MAG TPA: radical SAM protein [Acidobacteriota bacterium]